MVVGGVALLQYDEGAIHRDIAHAIMALSSGTVTGS